MQKTILVTGGAGFIGSNFVPYFAKKYKNYKVINLDKLTYAGNLKNLKECEGAENYIFVEGDICDEELMENIFKNYGVSDIIHFAA
ncbi:MAG: GDP-mannose 4,6-dehydratase, partial [Rickettsiales bacterium]|nr:GDP-mannose 4,6-dehydratase [Rickettsiales bacterium]